MKAWIKKVIETHNYHVERLRAMDGKHTLQMTADNLKRSIGSVAEDVLVARWLKTHSYEIEKFSYKHEAVNYIRDKKHKLLLEN